MGFFRKAKSGIKKTVKVAKKGAGIVADRASDAGKTTVGLGKDLTRITVKKGSPWWQKGLGAAVMYTMAAVIGIWLALFGVNYPELKAAVINSFSSGDSATSGQWGAQPDNSNSASPAGAELAGPAHCDGIEDLSTVTVSGLGKLDLDQGFVDLTLSGGFDEATYSIDIDPEGINWTYWCTRMAAGNQVRCTGETLPERFQGQQVSIRMLMDSQCSGKIFSQRVDAGLIARTPAGVELAVGPICDGSISGFATYDEKECTDAGGDFDESYCHCP